MSIKKMGESDIIPDDNLYNEIYALIKLQSLFPNFKAFSINDKIRNHTECPDWQSKVLDIGIEVTRGIPDFEEKQLIVIRNTFGRGYHSSDVQSFIDRKKINKKMKNKIIVEDYDGHTILSVEGTWYDTSLCIEAARRRLIDKSRKFDKYIHYSTNALYISCSTLLRDYDVPKIIDNCKIPYDVVFFDFGFQVIEYYVNTSKSITHIFSEEQLENVKKEAFFYRKPEWSLILVS